MNFKRKRGFTITELVIVIAVIAILAAVLIPTFGGIINKANQSADQTLVKQINETLYEDSVLNGAPKNYVELMTLLSKNGYCDMSNMYMLATEIKQDDMYLAWFVESNTVGLITDISAQFFDSTVACNYYNYKTGEGEGNGVNNYCYIISTATAGDFGDYAKWYVGEYGSGSVRDTVFAQVIKQYETNKAAGMTSAQAKTDWYDANKSAFTAAYSATDNLPVSVPAEVRESLEKTGKATGVTEVAVKEAIEQANKEAEYTAATTLTGLVKLVNSGVNMEGKTINISAAVVEVDASGNATVVAGTIDMTGATYSPISDLPRKNADQNSIFKGSLDMGVYTDDGTLVGSTEVKGMTLNNTYVPNNTELQTAGDNGTADGGYVFNYGLFAYASSSYKVESGQKISVPCVIKNITLTDVDLDCCSSTITKDGVEYPVVTDCAGILVGYGVGDLVFENIKVGTADKPAVLSAYDGTGVLVGRHYGNTKTDFTLGASTTYEGYTIKGDTLIAKNCELYATITGDRRVGGIVGYAANEVKQFVFDNVTAVINQTLKPTITSSCANQVGVIGCLAHPGTVITLKNGTNIDGSTSVVNSSGYGLKDLDLNKIKSLYVGELPSGANASGAKILVGSGQVDGTVNIESGSTVFGVGSTADIKTNNG